MAQKKIETQKREGDEILQLVSFKIANEEFGINILRVQEIIRLMDITQLPEVPELVHGIINLRDKVIPIINLRRRLGLEDKESDKDSRIIIVEIGDTIFGFIVDSVSEVLRIPENTIQPPPETISEIDSKNISGISKLEDRLLIILDLENTLICDNMC